MILSRKIELKPNNRQKTMFRQHVGCARFAYNWGLSICIETNRLTHHLAKNHGVIVIEDLNVSGMMRNHHLAASIAAANFSEVRRQLEYKTRRFGSRLVVVDRFYPSSQLCSGCGYRQKMPLHVRQYDCPECGLSLNRDVNAARNLAANCAVTARWNPEIHAGNGRCGNCHAKKSESLLASDS